MQIVLHVSGYYEWEAVPSDVEVTEDDKASLRVKTAQNGTFLMKVEKDAETLTTINITENELQELAISEMTRGDKKLMSREELAHRCVARMHLDHNTHPDWIEEVEVHDDGPRPGRAADDPNGPSLGDVEAYRALLLVHTRAINPNTGQPNIQERDVERMIAKYTEPSSAESHVDHLHEMFNVPLDRIAAHRAKHAKAKEDAETAREEHLAEVERVASAANPMHGQDPAKIAAADKRFADAVAASKSKTNNKESK